MDYGDNSLLSLKDEVPELTENAARKSLIIVGNIGGTNVGPSFRRAANSLGFVVHYCDAARAFAAPSWIVRFNWWLRGHRPTYLRDFSREVLEICEKVRPRWLLCTGQVPVDARALRQIGALGVVRLNYLTDDPWNLAHRAPWFFDALTFYDNIFSVRRANLPNLTSHGCKVVEYLPFGFDPELFYPEAPSAPEEDSRLASDVVFAGGADRDRVPYIAALLKMGLRVGLYGSYWERYPETRMHTRGQADVRTLRLAIAGAKVALCPVRRANRDGNSMRTFEIPAVGSCMLTEDTWEHREIFGDDGKAVVYFRSIDEMLKKMRWLLVNDQERKRLATAAHNLIVNGRNTYKDRLITMLKLNEPGFGNKGLKVGV